MATSSLCPTCGSTLPGGTSSAGLCPACLLGGLLSDNGEAEGEPTGRAYLEAGAMLGPFRIVGLLGVGGMATVYQAYDSSLERDVALKVLPPEYLHEESFARRFRQEARVIARLEHPNIVPIYASGIDQGIPWMSMRLLGGGSLGAVIGRARPTLEQTVRMLRAVANALDYAHARGIIHRDIKPTNILLDRADHVCVADFGLAYMMDLGLPLTRSGTVAGTPQYMAPEQGLGKTIDHRCDIYSLGVVAFEMLTGLVPFTADSPVAVLLKHVNEPAPALASDVAPVAVARAVQKALEKDPESRWQSAGEFVRALEQTVTGADNAVRVARDRRGRLAWVAGTLALAALILAAFSYELVRTRGSATTSAAVVQPPAPNGVPLEGTPVVNPPVGPPVIVETPEARPPASVPPGPRAQEPAVPPGSRGGGRGAAAPVEAASTAGRGEPERVPPPGDPPTTPITAGTTGAVIAPAGPSGAGTPGEALEPPKPLGDVVTSPIRVREVKPTYPPMAKAAQVAGDVVLQVMVAADGTVTDATVLSSVHRLLNEPALRAVRQYRYKPALRNGVPEPGRIKETVSFRIE